MKLIDQDLNQDYISVWSQIILPEIRYEIKNKVSKHTWYRVQTELKSRVLEELRPIIENEIN